MAYTLNSTDIKRPSSMREDNSSQFAQNRSLDGSITRDYFGSNKREWTLSYQNTTKTDFDTINTIYNSYLSTGNTVTWEITETNYTVSEVNVHVDLVTRDFRVGGSSYITEFNLILTEA